ncbi:uncharacterized protein PAC_01704 [Phialocephala subalpina]|uniref:Peptidase S33 tripeptidyl aminopeptidase-like C-terminal domain-containing protein n=1 Tax=Phialocephala subalpina TaxID=576137 RepID=A0A1L7WGG4_9HELO|nr:uncharacterized protein PAC_01704 [Phialocephala subalpina]
MPTLKQMLWPVACFIVLLAIIAHPVLNVLYARWESDLGPKYGWNSKLMTRFADLTPSTNLTWSSCFHSPFNPSIPPYQCAVFDVPLDYEDPKGPRAYVPLIRFPATNRSSYQGMVLYNPGGPGRSGIDSLRGKEGFLRSGVPNTFDIIAWEPRGVQYRQVFRPVASGAFILIFCYSMPMADCSADSDLYIRAASDLVEDDGICNEYLKTNKVFGPKCPENLNAVASHMGTGVVVKDMLAIVDAFSASESAKGLRDASLLNFWGLSYGSFIGQTFASLFPDRVGRVVLDGILNPDDYLFDQQTTKHTDTDHAFLSFFMFCYRAGHACSYHTGSSAYDIFERFKGAMNRIHDTRLSWLIKFRIFKSLNSPERGFPKIANDLKLLDDSKLEHDAAARQKLSSEFEKSNPFNDRMHPSHIGTKCSDTSGTRYNSNVLESSIAFYKNESFIGSEAAILGGRSCIQWLANAKGIYAGPFGGKTKNPMLVVSNTLDFKTPLENGYTCVQKFPGAELLTVHGTGHTSPELNNSCAFQKIATYFKTGAVPGEDNHCPEEPGPWNVTIEPFETHPDWLDMKRDMAKIRAKSVEGDQWKKCW